MISGLAVFTVVHVVISLVGIFSGFVVTFGLLAGNRLDGWTVVFLTGTALTSVTGFFFPFHGITPGIVVGGLSVVLLALAIFARYSGHLAGRWRGTYVIAAMMALYLNVFVLVVQLFEKVPALAALAPTQSEPPFKLAQGVVLICFVVLTVLAMIRFHAHCGPNPSVSRR